MKNVGSEADRGKVEISFKRMSLRNPPFDNEQKRLELLHRLNQIPHVTPERRDQSISGVHTRPLRDEQNLRNFFLIMDWTTHEVSEANGEA